MYFVKILNISFESFSYPISKMFRRSLKSLKCTKLFYTKFSIHPKRKIVKSFEYMFITNCKFATFQYKGFEVQYES